MKNLYFSKAILCVLMLFALLAATGNNTFAQCANNNVLWTDLTPGGVGQTASTGIMYAGEYCTVTVCSGAQYIFSTCTNTYDTQLTLYSSTGTYLGYDDDGCGTFAGPSYLVWTATFSGEVWILLDQYNCVSNSTNTTLSVTQNTVCAGGGETICDCDGDEIDSGVLVWLGDDVADNNTYTWNGTFVNFNCATWGYDCGDFGITNDPWGVCLGFMPPNNGCIGSCSNLDALAAFWQCIGTQAETDFYYFFEGGCYVDQICIGPEGGTITCFDAGSFIGNGNFTTLFLNIPNAWYEYYYILDDGTYSQTFYYYNGYCGDDFCSNLDSDAVYAGCEYSSGTGQDEEGVDFYFYYTGACTVEGIYIAADGSPFTYYDLSADGLGSGDFAGFFLYLDYTLYDYYYVLSDGTTSPFFAYYTGECAGTGCDDAIFYMTPDCWGSEISWDITDQFGNPVYESPAGIYVDGLPGGTGEWFSELCLDPGCYFFNIYDSFGDGVAGAQYLECDVDGYYYMTDGDGNTLFSMTAANYGYGTSHFFCINEGGCSNLDGFFTAGECDFTGVDPVLPWYFTFEFDGDCNVVDVCLSENGGAYTCYDMSIYGLLSGEQVVYNIGQPNSYYYVYYTLSDGSASGVFYFETGDCDAEFTICDCAGTVHDGGVLVWLGDGVGDDGTYLWNGQPVDFNCSTWGYDCGDIAGAPNDDPYGVCSGNLPPANGCIDDPLCEVYEFHLLTDCWPLETGWNLYDEFGNLVAYIEPGGFNAEYTDYYWTLCLPEGCYDIEITDAYGDGMAATGIDACDFNGDFWYFDADANLVYDLVNPAFGFSIITEECIELPYTCFELDLSLYQEPCADFDGTLEPVIGFTFDYNGTCNVVEMCWSEDGGAYACQDVTEFDWQSGDAGILSPTSPNTTYYFYYILSDGSYSSVFIFENGNCENETVICDCNETQHTIGVLAWLGDGFADDGTYEWEGQTVDFNCSTWGYDCGDIDGAPDLDPYNVCSGGLPPNNGCDSQEEILGCTDPQALNYNPLATIEDGSCLYDVFSGCTDEDACNYNSIAVVDDGSCEYITCAGCTDDEALNYDPTATIEDGSCIYDDIEGCTDEDALNYNELANVDDGSCVYQCVFPQIEFDSFCEEGVTDEFFITIDVNALGNGAPYTVANTYDDQQVQLNFNGTIEMGPFPTSASVVIQVTSNMLDGCFLTSPVMTEDCEPEIITGCMDELAENYNPDAVIDDGSCTYDFMLCDCDGIPFSPELRFLLGNDNADMGSPNFNCEDWGYDCGDIAGAPDDDPYGVCDGNVPEELYALLNGCPDNVSELDGVNFFSIFPNPNNGQFTLFNSGNNRTVVVRIHDAAGRLVFAEQLFITQRSSVQLNVSTLAQGTYTLELWNGEMMEHHKLVVQY